MKTLLSLVFVLLLAACGAPSAPVGPEAAADLDLSMSRRTEQGAFQVTYTSDLEPPAINALHAWTVHVETPEGKPVTGATLSVEGGMPIHNHGLPTSPVVTEVGGGDYRVEGMKYQMPGHWTVTVRIDGDGRRDAVIFNLVLP